jgi:tRNA pseudouridine13 synthase
MDVTLLPHAGPVPAVAGRYRTTADDFVVEERLGFALDAAGEHLYLHIEKRGENTSWVAERLARHYGVASVDVGYAGQKDRHAVARQWFSVRLPGAETLRSPVTLPADARITLLAHGRHGRKLRPGDHAGNRFVLALRTLSGDRTALDARLEKLRTAGRWSVPNYFGPQRFGRDGANTERARAWLVAGGRPPRARNERARLLSAARALLFNHVLAARVADDSWQTPVDGDDVQNGAPTGPLWGRGRSMARGRAAELESDALEPFRSWLNPLEHCGLRQDRRPLAVTVAEFNVEQAVDAVRVAFSLPAGSFATSVLRELGCFDDHMGTRE